MSVIFKTLKKLKTESPDKANSKYKLVRKRRIYFFKKSLYSPFSVLLLLLLLTVIGAGTLYGYYHLRETKGGNTIDFAVPNTVARQSTDGNIIESLEGEGTRVLNQAKDLGSNQIEYIPPKANDNRTEVYASNQPDDTKIPFITAKKPSLKSKVTINRNAVAKKKNNKEDKSVATEVSAIPEVEKIFLENAKKNAKIARLVADIHWEMGQGNKYRTEILLDELALLKGQNNSYVLKLKAVSHIQHEEFERAKDLLKIVLTKNEFDQEAGINMAIIEINTKHMQKAYQRLAKLQILYPENIRIAEIMRDLKLLFKKSKTLRFSRNDG